LKIIDIHQANVIGLGAENFASSLLRQLRNNQSIRVHYIYVNRSVSRENIKSENNVIFVNYIFGGISRLLEIFFWKLYRGKENDLLVLGDLPLNTHAKQYVLCQQSLIFKNFSITSLSFYKFALFRFIFKKYLKKNDVVLVQTHEMARKVKGVINDGVDVQVIDLKSEFFGWPQFCRSHRYVDSKCSANLNLVYPAAPYPHKNHYLLDAINLDETTKIILTINKNEIDVNTKNVNFIGRVSREKVFDIYKTVDALLFLSSNESLGMPILEAIKCNIPIICPYAEYTKYLKSENCFFFDIEDPISLELAIASAKRKLMAGWWSTWDFELDSDNSTSVPLDEIILNK
jgi:hypothetical protein